MTELEKNKSEDWVQEHAKSYTIFVNTRVHTWPDKEISFEQVIILHYGSISSDPMVIYTVTYKKGHSDKPEGSMVKGTIVKVKNEMRFNVSDSINS